MHTHMHTCGTNNEQNVTSAVKSFCHKERPSSLVFAFSISPSCLAVWSVSPLVPTSSVTSVQLLHSAVVKERVQHIQLLHSAMKEPV